MKIKTKYRNGEYRNYQAGTASAELNIVTCLPLALTAMAVAFANLTTVSSAVEPTVPPWMNGTLHEVVVTPCDWQ